MSIELLSELNRNLRLLFYPSSGPLINQVMSLPYELFIFADKEPRTPESKATFVERMSREIGGFQELKSAPNNFLFRKESKLGLLYFEDNNVVRRKIKEDGRKIDCFVGRCDGCSEGGNYECVNDSEFLTKLIALTPEEGMTYYTDHSSILSDINPSSERFYDNPRPEVILSGKLLSKVGVVHWWKPHSQWGPIYEYKITHHQATVRERHVNGIRITLEHDSIADYLDGVDGVYVSTRCRQLFKSSDTSVVPGYKGAPDYYFMPSLKSEWSTGDSVRSLLELCERKKWRIVGTTAFGEDHHLGIIQVLKSWRGTYPEWIRIFHFDHNDYSDIDELFHKVDPAASL